MFYEIINGIPALLPPRSGNGQQPAADVLQAQERSNRDAHAGRGYRAGESVSADSELAAILRLACCTAEDVVLDAGMGEGRTAVALARTARAVVGFDHSLNSCRSAVRSVGDAVRHRLHVAQGDGCRPPIRSEIATLAVSGQVLQHVPGTDKRRAFVAGIRRTLQPDGRLVMTVLNHSVYFRARSRIHSLDRPLPDVMSDGNGDRLFPKEGLWPCGLYYHRFSRRDIEELLHPYFRVHKLRPLCATDFAPASRLGRRLRVHSDALLARCAAARMTSAFLGVLAHAAEPVPAEVGL